MNRYLLLLVLIGIELTLSVPLGLYLAGRFGGWTPVMKSAMSLSLDLSQFFLPLFVTILILLLTTSMDTGHATPIKK